MIWTPAEVLRPCRLVAIDSRSYPVAEVVAALAGASVHDALGCDLVRLHLSRRALHANLTRHARAGLVGSGLRAGFAGGRGAS